MVKAEWGAKHGCPKCGTRFYDLGKDDPITCIECGYAWHADPVLKSKQPIPYEEIQKDKVEVVEDGDDLVADASGDRLDAVLCLLQAAWALGQPRYGMPAVIDRLEGWIISA